MQTEIAGIGIDAEIHDSLPQDVIGTVCVAEEIAWLRQAPARLHWDRVLFSAKESVYKAWFPVTQRWLGFEDVAITIEAAEGTFRVRPLVSLPSEFDRALRQFVGRFLVRNGVVITAVVLPRIS
jgi:4'-phosphopantetheinyl transferase EntD